MEFLHLFLRRHFAGKPLVPSRNVVRFLRMGKFLTWITDIQSSSLGRWFIVISVQYFTIILWGFSHTTHPQTKMTNKSASKLSSALCWQGKIGRRAWSQVPEKKEHKKIVLKFSVLKSGRWGCQIKRATLKKLQTKPNDWESEIF